VQVEAEPNDHMALAKWGELLLELAMLKQGEEATTILLQVNSQKKKNASLIPTLNKRTQPHSLPPLPPPLSLSPSLPPSLWSTFPLLQSIAKLDLGSHPILWLTMHTH
jgi:hypothetical protein